MKEFLIKHPFVTLLCVVTICECVVETTKIIVNGRKKKKKKEG